MHAGWITAALGWIAGTLAAQTEPATDGALVSGPLAQAIDAYLTRCVPFGFSGTVLVVEKGLPILVQGYGVAERTSGAACTSATVFDLGQLAQPFTACAVLVLEQQKKLETKDTLDRFFADIPADKKKIQLQHLLVHTSGLPWSIPGVGPKLVERDELVRAALRMPLLDTPGADCVPSDVGYALLAAVIETVTKQSFEDALRELVFRPAGLASTGFRQGGALAAEHVARAFLRPDEPPPEGALGLRFPLDPDLAEERELASEGWYSWALRGAGGVLTSAPDLWRFEQALRGDALLTKASKKKLFAPALDDMACGWLVRKAEKKTLVHERSGWTKSGFAAECVSAPGDESFVVLLSNAPAVPRTIAADVRALVAGKVLAPPPATTTTPESALAALAGEYEALGGARWRAFAHGSALFLEARTPAALELVSGKLSGDQKHLLTQAEEIVAGLRHNDFTRLHEFDRDLERFHGVESWWRELLAPHGTLREATLLGLRPDANQLNHLMVRLEFEHGEELLDLQAGDEYFFGLDCGPPYASRLRFVPRAEHGFVCYDLVAHRQVAGALRNAAGELELELPGGKVTARKR
ncbi:MAG: class A beta-lactamase-related serine hydrolase [Planctomycetes bacterium]|nr:class A beta-lactamase-related serine hydrolase [Planctomycetota bacterium]